MHKFLAKLFIFISLTSNAFGAPNIIVSIVPIATIVSMLTNYDINITILDKNSGCPHHHQAKFSDKVNLADSEMIIYIDKDFENIHQLFPKDYKGTIVQISDFENIKLKTNKGLNNYHFWLDLDNVLIIQLELANIIINKFPHLKENIIKNLAKAQDKIKLLKIEKEEKLKGLDSVIILTDSVEHFFKGLNFKDLYLFEMNNSSLSNFNKLNKLLISAIYNCIIISEEQDEKPYLKYGGK